jgi:hypothetical protein
VHEAVRSKDTMAPDHDADRADGRGQYRVDAVEGDRIVLTEMWRTDRERIAIEVVFASTA